MNKQEKFKVLNFSNTVCFLTSGNRSYQISAWKNGIPGFANIHFEEIEYAAARTALFRNGVLGFEEKRHYPYDIFWELVAKVGTDVIVGCDAHKAVSCGNPIIYKEAIKKLETFGITPIKTVKLREV